MQRHAALLALVAMWPAAAAAQDTTAARISGRFSTRGYLLDNQTNSSKVMEYRDLRDPENVYLSDLRFDVFGGRGLFLDVAGTNVSRRDQSLRLAAGDVGAWRVDLAWNEIPHDLSNKARSPYFAAGAGVLEVSQPIAIPFKKLNTVAADAPNVLASDAVVAAYQQAFLRPIALGTQTNTGTVGFRFDALENVALSLGYTRRTKRGSRPSYGPIGDRPPRTLNIELAEPVDYRTGELATAVEYDGGAFQGRVEYHLKRRPRIARCLIEP